MVIATGCALKAVVFWDGPDIPNRVILFWSGILFPPVLILYVLLFRPFRRPAALDNSRAAAVIRTCLSRILPERLKGDWIVFGFRLCIAAYQFAGILLLITAAWATMAYLLGAGTIAARLGEE
jgi:hypothetical protein